MAETVSPEQWETIRAAAAAGGALLLVDKASGWTSHDTVARSRRVFGTKKIGHAGTLDPLATGLLILGVGPATRLLTHLVGLPKTYTATIRLGQRTVTDDSEGETVEQADRGALDAALDPERLQRAVAALNGEIMQVPTAVSAIKVNGQRAYNLVRAGQDVDLKARPVTIHSFTVGEPRLIETPAGPAVELEASVDCSSGTYVRALARDLGEALGVGGHLTALRRTAVGPFRVTEAVSSSELDRAARWIAAERGIVPRGSEKTADQVLAEMLAEYGEIDFSAINPLTPGSAAQRLWPVLELDTDQAVAIRHGKRLRLPAGAAEHELAAAVDPQGRLAAMVRVTDGEVRVVTGFAMSVERAE